MHIFLKTCGKNKEVLNYERLLVSALKMERMRENLVLEVYCVFYFLKKVTALLGVV